MIVTNLTDLTHQVTRNTLFDQAVEFLRQARYLGATTDRIEIVGEDLYALIQSYATRRAEAKVNFEGHRTYIDIQYLIEGKETIFWTPAEYLTPTIPYDESKDIWFSDSPIGDATPVVLTPGRAAVFFPSDAHATRYAVGTPMPVRKVILKVAVSRLR